MLFSLNPKPMEATAQQFHVVVSSRYENIDVVQTLLGEALDCVSASEQECHWIDLALREALANAIKHGNGENPEKRVRVDGRVTAEGVWIEVEDEGDGFTPEKVEDPLAPENLLSPSGRGLLYIRNAMDQVELRPGPKGGTLMFLFKELGASNAEESEGS
ncbi:MAG: ATP-binding protein [Acidobacteriota bacterium]